MAVLAAMFFCNVLWRSGVVPLKWEIGVVVPIFKKEDKRLCSNYRGITVGKSMPGLERGVHLFVEP